MKCNNCDSPVKENDNFCSACGVENPQSLFSIQRQSGRDIKLILLYCGWLAFVSVVFVFVNKFFIHKMLKGGQPYAGESMATINLVTAGADVLWIFLVLLLVRAKTVRTAFIIFFILKAILLASYYITYTTL